MKQSDYIKLDNEYRKNLEYYDTKNLGIAAVGMFLFSTFILAGALGEMDHIVVFNIYIICCFIASSLYLWPLLHVRENQIVVSIFRKYRCMPIDKKFFVNAKLILLIRFSIIFYFPLQAIHFIGLMKTDTYYLSIIGFWPLFAIILSICVQYLILRFMARDFME